MSKPLAHHDHVQRQIDATIEFIKRTRFELRELRKVRVWRDRFLIVDINGDAFEVRGVGYAHPDIVSLLNHINAGFNPATIHDPTDLEYKEFKTGKRRPWAEDRVM